MKSFIKYNWPSVLWAAFILVLCLMPGKDLPEVDILNFDKMAHAGVYFILALLTYWGWQKQSGINWLHVNAAVKIILITAAYGFAVEVMQKLFTTDRQFDLLDAAANAFGATIGTLISVKLLAPRGAK